ncbi:hypothetical protein JYU34_003287 [Plutella xylostella]|uniref:Zinc finger PHD-type domain-containing protein n=2 Tax=Plutella xylostella TaxID=51655 RepID=A0ABQ7QZN0_PLUXY|nr:hypothetical protein JYU34_003287 [Plutella xylostella]
MICSKCKDVVTDAVVCGVCHGTLHFNCAGVAETSYRRMGAEKKAAWRCIACRSAPAQPATSTLAEMPAITELISEIKAFRAEFTAVKADISSASIGIQNLNTKWNEMESRFSNLEDRLVIMETKMATVSKLELDLKTANETINKLQIENNSRDQYARMNNLEISGVPVNKGENLINILHSICAKVGITMQDSDLDSIHRVRRFPSGGAAGGAERPDARPPSIIVRFTRRRAKDQLLAGVRARRGLSSADLGLPGPAAQLYVSDHLTPANKLLLKRARELKSELNFTYLWVRDCKIYMRKSDNAKVVVINNECDLKKLK